MTCEEMKTEIRKAITSAKYNSFSPAGRISSLTGLIVGYGQRKGQGIMEDAAMRTAENLDSDIARYYGNELSFNEILLAIDWGMHRIFGEFSGLNVDRFFEFVRLYKGCPERAEVVSEISSQSIKLLRHSDKKDPGSKNWEAMFQEFKELCKTWNETKTVEATLPASSILFPTARRHLTAMCYTWLKVVGEVGNDTETLSTEANMIQEAEERLKKEKRSDNLFEQTLSVDMTSKQKSLAYSLMMMIYFRTKDIGKVPLSDVIADIDTIPTEDRRFYDG